jgi:glycosyltransferase involved in cell wall biosynthesis
MKEQINSLNINQISIAIPSYNTLNYLMMAYRSLRKYYPKNEIIIMDDGSTDGSWEWTEAQTKFDENLRTYHNTSGNIIGHTVTYNIAARMCKGPLYTIFHSDMIAYKGYLENMLKHWKPKTVVSATRIEPEGIYPPGKEKILKPFGIEFHEFKQEEFEKFCEQEQKDSKDVITAGIFAPWLISKEDYLFTGTMDEKYYGPYPHEDFDAFLRWKLAGYNLIQSRDSLCFHWISRGHRSWAKNGVGKDDDMFKFYNNRASRNYIRKWHKWMSHDEYRMPITHPVYNIGFVLTDVTSEDFLHFVETWATNIFVDNMICAERYIAKEQPTTKIDLKTRIYNHGYIEQINNDILLYFSQKDFMQAGNENAAIIMKLTDILSDGIENNSELELGIFKLKTKMVKDLSDKLIKI